VVTQSAGSTGAVAETILHRKSEVRSGSSRKDPGVVISNDLKVSQQRQQAYNKASRILGLINRTIEYRHTDILLRLQVLSQTSSRIQYFSMVSTLLQGLMVTLHMVSTLLQGQSVRPRLEYSTSAWSPHYSKDKC